MKLLLILLLAVPSLSLLAQSENSSRVFCDGRLSSPEAVQNIINQSQNQLSFTNQGGIFGGGVCWWHSRFTRAAAYLAVFDPSLPRPTEEEAQDIINTLRDRKRVVVIPGYQNLYEFSRVHREKIQDKLNDWQRSDGVLKASWIQGLQGSSETEASKLQTLMDELFERVSAGEVVYQKLQMPGVVAHAWLVTGMEQTRDGYRLTVVDSNVGRANYTYRQGMTSFNYHGWYQFVPYTHQTKEEEKLREKLADYCR